MRIAPYSIGFVLLVASPMTAQEKPALAIEFRWAEDKAIAGVTQKTAVELSCSKEKQYLHEKAVLTNADIAKVDVLPMPNTNGEKVYFEVRLTKEAEQVMTASSAANQNKPLVVLVDGKIVAAMVVMTKLTNVIPVVSPLSKAEAERIVKGIAGLKS